MAGIPLTEEDLHELYLWVDDIPLSRPKRNIARDFSDGICVAEVVKHFFPKLVELHNYTPANSVQQKVDNWNTLNARVFRKLHFEVPPEEIRDITAAVPGAIERFLRALRTKIAQIKARQESAGAGGYSSAPAAPPPPPPVAAPQHRAPVVAAAPALARPPTASTAGGANMRQLLDEKDRAIFELQETVALLSDKVAKLEELVHVKDRKIAELKQRAAR